MNEPDQKGGAPGSLVLILVWLLLLYGALGPLYAKGLFSVEKVLFGPISYFKPEAKDFLKQREARLEGLSEPEKKRVYGQIAGELADYLGLWYGKVVLSGILGLVALIMARTPAEKYCRRMNMRDLLVHNSKKYPCLMPLLKISPITNEKYIGGVWAMAASPLEFVVNLEAFLDEDKSPWSRENILDLQTGLAREDSLALKTKNNYDQKKISDGFSQQLGGRYKKKGTDCLVEPSFYHKALKAAFLAHLYDEKNEAFRILDELSSTWDPNTHQVFAKGVDGILQKFGSISNPELAIHESYVNVYFMALCGLSRSKGSLPSSLWIWLRPTDRPLFYALNQMGGRTVWVEAAGVLSHYQAEVKAGRTLEGPSVVEATRALLKELVDESWLPQSVKDGIRNEREQEKQEALKIGQYYDIDSQKPDWTKPVTLLELEKKGWEKIE